MRSCFVDNVIKTKDEDGTYYHCGGTDVSLIQEDVLLDFLDLDPEHIPHLIACLQAIQVDLGQPTLPTIPPEVMEAMGRVERTQGGSSGVGWMDFWLPAGHATLYDDYSDASKKNQMRDRAAATLVALQWLDSPEGKAWSGEVSDG